MLGDRVFLGEIERRLGEIGREDRRRRQQLGERDRDAARAGADLKDLGRHRLLEQCQQRRLVSNGADKLLLIQHPVHLAW